MTTKCSAAAQQRSLSIDKETAALLAGRRKNSTKLDTGLNELKKSGHVVVKAKSQAGSSSSSASAAAAAAAAVETTEEIKKRKEEAALASLEACKRVQLHVVEMRKKKLKKEGDGGLSPAMKAKAEEKLNAVREKLLYRAKIYAMNCLMKSFREVQIAQFYSTCSTEGGERGKEEVKTGEGKTEVHVEEEKIKEEKIEE